jgi:hypothetical protein
MLGGCWDEYDGRIVHTIMLLYNEWFISGLVTCGFVNSLLLMCTTAVELLEFQCRSDGRDREREGGAV